jgi:hypothetical protein
MDRSAWFRADDPGPHSPREAGRGPTALTVITWLAARSDYASSLRYEESVHGIGWVLFGVGVAGASWLRGLAIRHGFRGWSRSQKT